jgi:serine/threonine protein kinase
MSYSASDGPPGGARYTVMREIGSGTFGSIYNAWDNNKKCCVAIKNLPNAFGSRSGRHHALRELSILRQTM